MKKVLLSENALTVAKNRYFMDGEDWEDCVKRVCNVIASPEISNRQKIYDEFCEEVYNMYFLPAGRILRNSGRPKGSLLNCFHISIGDSIEEIGQCLKDTLVLWSEGGGVGINFSPLRPKNDAILGKGGKSSGLVSFMEAFDAAAGTIESGGARRAAAIGHVDVIHPEVIDFIDAKILHEKLNHFNISVSVNEDFLLAVEADSNWTFKFKQKDYNTVKARDIWNKIIANMTKYAEPGLINWSNFQKNNSYYFAPVIGTNPCHTGDTLVAVADGRKHVAFKQLAEENKDIPVFSRNRITGKVEIKIMRNPRKTSSNQKIYKVFLDDNMYFRCNEAHKVTMVDGTEKEVKDLKPNDRLHHMIKYNAKLKTILGDKNTNNNSEYIWLNNGFQTNVAEHRVIAQFINGGKELENDEVVHHIDYNYQNNNPTNLLIMKKTDHDDFHKKDKLGENNPIHRFPEKNYFKKYKFLGTENGNSKGYEIDELFSIAQKFVKELKRPPMIKEWQEYCQKNNYPFWSADMYKIYGNHKKFLDEVCRSLDILVLDNQMLSKSYKKFVKIKNETDLDVYWDNSIKVNKVCEECGNNFITHWGMREQSYCSQKCCCINANRVYYNNKKTCNLNFKVIKIEEDGYEDLYNGTVDDNHNYYIYVGESKTKSGRPKLNYINSKNCGETCLSGYESCDLGSLVLPNFITGNVNTNWKKLEGTIKTAIRFLDNVLEVNKYTLKEIEINSHKTRRIGIGVIGLAEYLFAKKLRYGSYKAVVETERLMRYIRDVAYQASMELAIEKGSFPQFDSIPYGKASFIRKLPASQRLDIKKYGIRNCTLMALAPTGTISLLTNYSSAIEPLFAKAMRRSDRVSERIYIHPKYKEILNNNEDIPEWYVDAFDLEPKDHFEMQVICQRYCDGAVSKTINLPKETTENELSDLLLEYIHDLKGVTVYRDGSREGQILNRLSHEDVKTNLEQSNDHENFLEDGDIKCSTGSCEL